MRDAVALTYLPDPFALGTSCFGVMDEQGAFRRVEPVELHDLRSPVVTLNSSELIEELKRLNQDLPRCIIDITEALRLLSGRAKKDGGERQWQPWKLLASSTHQQGVLATYRKAFESQVQLRNQDRINDTLRVAAEALVSAWSRVSAELEKAGELERFMRVEVPVAQIFFRRQRNGIAIDLKRLSHAHKEAKSEKYRAYIEVANQTNVSPTGMTFRNVDRYLGVTDAAYLGFAKDFTTLEDYFRLASGFSTFASSFLTYIRADRDVNILSRLYNPEGRAYPRFHPHGTVTSRILVSDPFLQQLRRKHRGVIAADKGLGLIYLDYRQFEPGILAGLSADSALISAYNSKDLYSSLADVLFRDKIIPDARNLCKRMFLGFCYGMSKEHIAKVVAGPAASDVSVHQTLSRVNGFFGEFSALGDFKHQVEQELLQRGYVGTLMGNRRNRTHEGELAPNERRWAISQIVQGNASLVFKEALLQLQAQFGSGAILLPMHDAVLLQFEVGTVRQRGAEAAAIMRAAFEARFPSIKAKVSVERFAPEASG